MLTEFGFLAVLTLNSDEREILRNEIDEWVECFLPKLERESTREDKCRLVASVKRHEFGDYNHARPWGYCKFVGNTGIIFWEENIELERFKTTPFQRKILRRNPTLENVILGRFEIKEETGEWKLNDELKNKMISEGGEALIILEQFGKLETAVRIHVFDAFLFTTKFGQNELKWRTHLISDFEKAEDLNKDEKAVVPIHANIVKNFANVELFHIGDENEEDCLGWITILEKCDGNVRTELKNECLKLEERKTLAIGLEAGFDYLVKVGINHCDQKLENFLILGGVVKICDFGLVDEKTGRRSYRQMGYSRRGSKYRNSDALFSGSPAFANHYQLTQNAGYEHNYFYFLMCDWKTGWSLLYRPIDETEREKINREIKNCNIQDIDDHSHVINNITKIISLQDVSDRFCLDDSNLTKSCQMSSLKLQMTQYVFMNSFKNLTWIVSDQKSSNLCVPISVTTLLQYAIRHDLHFIDCFTGQYSPEHILITLTMIVYPRSLAGLNLNPKKEEKDFQKNDVETLLERVCKNTYLKKSGWEIIRTQSLLGALDQPSESTCEYKKVILNQNFVFSRPLTVTGAYRRYPSGIVVFHQMTLDRIENNTFILQNTDLNHSPEIRIGLKNPYYALFQSCYYQMLADSLNQTGRNFYDDGIIKMKLVNEDADNMHYDLWYLLPDAFSLELIRKNDAFSLTSDSSDLSDTSNSANLSDF